MLVALKQFGYNTTEEQVNVVYITRNFANARWLLQDFGDHCEGTRLDDEPKFLIWTSFLLRDFLQRDVPQDQN